MTSILVVCTGNICRSPMAEGFLRDALQRRFGDAAPMVSSAGTHGWEGSPATPEGVEAARELGADTSMHRGRLLTRTMAERADLLLCMATDHRDDVRDLFGLGARAFTLKELVRLLETLPVPDTTVGPDGFVEQVAAADAARRRGAGRPSSDDDIADPLGQPLEAYRGIAWEIQSWTDRLVDGLFGSVTGADALAEGGS
jgi:protein-tyrosine phosphatase